MCIRPTCESTQTHRHGFTDFLHICFPIHHISTVTFECEPVKAVVLVKELIVLSITAIHTHTGSWKLGQWKAPFSPMCSLCLCPCVNCSTMALVHQSIFRYHTGSTVDVLQLSTIQALLQPAARVSNMFPAKTWMQSDYLRLEKFKYTIKIKTYSGCICIT